MTVFSISARCKTVLALILIIAFSPAASQSAEPFQIGAILSMTGYAAFIGQGSSVALAAVEDETNRTGGINGRPVHFAIVDDQSNPAAAVQLANQIIAKGAPVMLGPSLTSDCAAVLPLVVQNGPLTYCLTPSIYPPAGSYALALGPSFRDLNLAMLRYFRGKGWKRIALLATTDASGQVEEREVVAALAQPENKDLTLVATEHFAVTDLSIGAQAARLKAANPEAILADVVGTPLGTALHGLHDVGLDVPVMAGAASIASKQIAGYASFLPASMLFSGYAFMAPELTRNPRVRAVQQQFAAAIAARNVDVTGPTASVYDPARLIVDAFRHLGTNATAAQLKTYIERTKDFPGINGVMDFTRGTQRGNGVESVVIVAWNASSHTFVPMSRAGGVP